VRALRDRLQATPTQERAFDVAVKRLRDTLEAVRARTTEARNDIARALSSEAFDESAFDAASSRIYEALQTLRVAVRSTLGDLHDTLDKQQRETLRDLIGSTRMDL
jgi:hypothetical protein